MKHCETLDITKNEMDNNIFYFLIRFYFFIFVQQCKSQYN